MRTRRLGKSEVEVGEIGLGTWGLAGEAYGPVAAETARATLDAALDAGMTLVETAGCYGVNGAIERMVGDAMRARGRDAVFVATRVGTERAEIAGGAVRKRFDRVALTAQADATLARLGTDRVDALVLHNPLPDTLRAGEAVSALLDLRAAGKARFVGVSVGSVAAARAALRHEIDLISLPYNLLHSRLLHTLAGEIASNSLGVLAHSTLAYGLLAGTWGSERAFVDGDHRAERWGPDDLARRVRQREAARYLVHDHVKSLREAAIRYVLANGLVTCAVVGARTPEHAVENAHAADELPYLAGNDLGSIGKVLRAEGVEM